MQELKPTAIARHLQTIAATFLFRGIAGEQVGELLNHEGVRLYRCTKRQAVDTGFPALYVLLRGQAVVFKEGAGTMMRINELQPGALFGMASLFLQNSLQSYPTYVTANAGAVLLMIEEKALHGMLLADSRVLENYLHYLTGRIHFLNTRIDSLICPGAKERLALYIFQNAVEGSLCCSMTNLAQALSISRATLYRAMDALESEGVIARQGRNIFIKEQSPCDEAP